MSKIQINYDKYSSFISSCRGWLLLIASVITLFALFSIPNLKVKNDSDKFSINKEDQVYKSQELFDSLFGANNYVYLLIESDSTDINIVKSLYTITNKIRAINGVKNVLSITDAERIEWISFFDILIPASVPVFTSEAGSIDSDSLKSFFRTSDLYLNNVVSKDFTKFNVIIGLKNTFQEGDGGASLNLVISEVDKVLSSYGLNYSLAGAPLLDTELTKIIKDDLRVFVPLSIIVSLLILIIVIRDFLSILSGLLIASISLIWSLAVISISDISMSVGLTVIIPLILVINIAYCIHYIFHYLHASISIKNNKDILSKTFKEVLVPSFLAGITTAMGFFSLLTSSFIGIREIGLYICIGVLFSMFNVNVMLPALLSYRKRVSPREIVLSKAFLNWMRAFTLRHYRFITGFFLLILVFALYGISNLKRDTNILHYIGEDFQIRKNFEKIDSLFGGSLPLEVILVSDYSRVNQDIGFIDSFSQKIKNERLIGSTVSIVDILKYIDDAIPPGNVNKNIPFSYEVKNFPKSIWRSISKSEIGSNFIKVQDTLIYLRIACRVKSAGSEELNELLNRLENYKNNNLKNRVITTGLVPFFVKSDTYLIASQINSFMIAFIFTLLLFLLFTRSLKVGLIALLTNLFPIIFTIGLLGFLNIPLDLSNIMIASIAIGIIVDDTVHFLFHYSKNKDLTASQNITLIYNSISSPILTTSIIISAGFFILGLSSFTPTKYFGILSGILVIVAVLSDLLLLPALLRLFEKSTS